MFAYCENNPISRSDPSGEFFFTIIGAVVGAAVGAIDAAIKHEDILAGALGGAVSGAISGAAADVIAVTGGTALAVVGVMAVAGAAGSLAENATKAAVTGEKIDWVKQLKIWLGALHLEVYSDIWAEVKHQNSAMLQNVDLLLYWQSL